MSTLGLSVGAAAFGAALMYELDPTQGRRRRARLRDAAEHTMVTSARAAQKALDDASHRLHGLGVRVRSRGERQLVDDGVLALRVRTCLGHYCSHPHAITATAQDGVVTLRGPILTREAPALLAHLRRVPGVAGIHDELERHDARAGVAALQGHGSLPRHGLMRASWTPSLRFAVGGAGAAALAFGASKGGLLGRGASLVGLGVLARAATNMSVATMLGAGAARRPIEVVKTVTIAAPPREVFAYFTAFDQFPKFMRHVREVKRLDGSRWHWKVDGPAGLSFEWDGIVTRAVEGEYIAWTSTETASVRNDGYARFEAQGDGTRLTIHIAYDPPLGALGHALAALTGRDPKHELDDDLLRFKSLLEKGKATGRAGELTRDQIRVGDAF